MRETKLWTWHIIAGVVIFFLLGLHMLTMHVGELTHISVAQPTLDPTHPVNSIARDGSLFYTIVYIVLLGAALFHGLYGLRNMVLELSASPGLEKAVNAILVLVGLGLFGLGTWAAVAVHGVALAAGRI
jgi:succinate dehydrogenase / fumarate reductase membrane anchor subunit